MAHTEQHEGAGKTFKLSAKGSVPMAGELAGKDFQLEDWWDRLTGKSWMVSDGNPAALCYAMRSGLQARLPLNDEVVYGKVGGFGVLVHVSELVAP